MTDLEKVKEFYTWLKVTSKFEESKDIAKQENVDCNQRLIIGEKGEWFWTIFLFKDGKLVTWYITE